MKLALSLLAAALLSAGAASAQSGPGAATQPNNSNPAAVPSGIAPPVDDPKGVVSPGQVFTKGAPRTNKMRNDRMMKRKKMKGDKMKSNLNTTM